MLKQLSVFIENKPGRLQRVIDHLASNEINIHALSIADTADFGILRIIVGDYEKAKKVLKAEGLTVKITDVVAVSLSNEPGSLSKVLEELEKISANIEYMYAFTSRSSNHEAMVILKLTNQEEFIEKMGMTALNVLSADMINEID